MPQLAQQPIYLNPKDHERWSRGAQYYASQQGPESRWHIRAWQRALSYYLFCGDSTRAVPSLAQQPQALADCIYSVLMRNKGFTHFSTEHRAHLRAECAQVAGVGKVITKRVPAEAEQEAQADKLRMWVSANRKRHNEATSRIYDAYFELCAERPGHHISNRDIAKRAGASRNTVNRIFSTGSSGSVVTVDQNSNFIAAIHKEERSLDSNQIPPEPVAMGLETEGDVMQKLTEADVIRLLQMRADGASQLECAVEFELSESQVYRIEHGKRWAHIDRSQFSIKRLRATGTRNGSAKLNEWAVQQIHKMRAMGYTQQTCAERFGVTVAQIGSIERGDTWAHVPRPEQRVGRQPRYVDHGTWRTMRQEIEDALAEDYRPQPRMSR
jgi:transcriptional regulator with XRE-family HTH domain